MIRVLSLGAGVQSTAVLLLALEGRLAPIDAAIFADTGWEPAAVYRHLAELERLAAAAGVPVYRVRGGDIRDTARPYGSGGAADAPFYLRSPDGREAMARRQCTSRLKVQPIRRQIRALLAERGIPARPGAVDQLFGISADEIQRVRTSAVQYVRHVYPLVDMRWRRHDAARYLAERGIDAPRSACIGCPYRTDAEWRRLRDDAPAEFADAAAWEREVQQRHRIGLDGVPYVHRSRVPLADVDLTTAEDRGQLTLADECEGLCGV